jgi:hypothetical protein
MSDNSKKLRRTRAILEQNSVMTTRLEKTGFEIFISSPFFYCGASFTFINFFLKNEHKSSIVVDFSI